jgi:hypothetical protein
MTSDQPFSDFELAGWEDESTAAAYDRHLSLVTTQSVEALLDDAHLSSGHKVLDVATGAGYVAAAAARRGAQPVGLDFRRPRCAWHASGTQAFASSKEMPKLCLSRPTSSTQLSLPSDSVISPIPIWRSARRSVCSSLAEELRSLSGTCPSR